MRRWLWKIIALFNDRSEAVTPRRMAWNGRPLNVEAVGAGEPGASEYGTLTVGLAVDSSVLAPAPSTSRSAPAIN
jgi:hypothetical protein